MITAGSPIKKFIEQTRKETVEGLEDWELKAPIDLEISAIVNGNVSGGIDISVVNFGAKVQAEQVQKIKLSIGPKDEAEQEEKKARVEIAKERQKYAKALAIKESRF